MGNPSWSQVCWKLFSVAWFLGFYGNMVNDIKPKMLPPMYGWLLVYSNARVLPQDLINKTFRARHLCGLHPLVCRLIQIFMNISFFSTEKWGPHFKNAGDWHLFCFFKTIWSFLKDGLFILMASRKMSSWDNVALMGKAGSFWYSWSSCLSLG